MYGEGVYGKSLYLSPNFIVNLTLLSNYKVFKGTMVTKKKKGKK